MFLILDHITQFNFMTLSVVIIDNPANVKRKIAEKLEFK